MEREILKMNFLSFGARFYKKKIQDKIVNDAYCFESDAQ